MKRHEHPLTINDRVGINAGRTQASYKTVVEDQTEVISRFKADGTFIFVNSVYCRFFGKREEELIGNKWHPVAHMDDRSLILRQLGTLSKDNPVVTIENRVWDGEGRLHWMQFVNRGFFDDKGQLIEIQSVGRDITALKEKERLLLDREDKIAQQAAELEKVNMALELLLERRRRQLEDFKDAVYGSFHHSVLPEIENLKRRLTTEAHRRSLSIIAQSLDHLLSPATAHLMSPKFGLTRMEIRIATMIRNGMASPEIAEHLNLSHHTVGFHRRNLRKKLGLVHSKTNLSDYLRNQMYTIEHDR